VKFSYFSLLLIFNFALSNIAFSEPIPIRFAEIYPVYFNDNGEIKGMDVDIINEVFSRANLDYKSVNRPFKRSLIEMQQGHVQVMTNITKNDDRSQYMEWIGPVRYSAIALIVAKKDVNLSIKSSRDLLTVSKQTGKKFGDIVGASYSDFFDDMKANNEEFNDLFELVPEMDSNYKKLTAGRILGFFADDFEFNFLMSQAKEPNEPFDQFAIHAFRIEGSEGGAYIGISKTLGKESITRIQQAFSSMVDDGTLETIHRRWSGEPIPAVLSELLKQP